MYVHREHEREVAEFDKVHGRTSHPIASYRPPDHTKYNISRRVPVYQFPGRLVLVVGECRL